MESLQDGLNRFWSLYHAGLWEPGTKAFFQEVLRPGDLYVDVGAWIGPTVMWALELGAEVIAIEPDAIALQDLYQIPDIEIWPVAVAPENGVVTLSVNPKEGGEWGDSMSRVGTEGVLVPALTLPEILDGRTPKLVKIDVEGYEIVLCPKLMPWLAEIGSNVQLSCHGEIPDKALFEGFTTVRYPTDTWGDVQCLM